MATTEKTILTRIINKNASLNEWMSSTLPLKKGEIALAYIETKQTATDANGKITVQYVPTYLMKVGDGTHAFKDLNWLAAPASDVYDWAKKAALDENDLPAEWKKTVDDGVANVANKLDKSVYDTFLTDTFAPLKATVDAFFAENPEINDITDTLVEIQAILDGTEDAQSLVAAVAALTEWHETNEASLETIIEWYNTHHTTLEKVTEQKITNWDKAFTNNHTHSNKTLLDSIGEDNVHVHTNKAELDKIADGDVAKWNAIEQNVSNNYVKHSVTDVEYILDCGNHVAR